MDGQGLREAAASSVSDMEVDTDALLHGVYRRHRQRNLLRGGGGAVAVAVLAFGVVTVISDPVTTSPDTAGPGMSDVPTELSAYTMSGASDADPLATVHGVELTYLPPGVGTEPSREDSGTEDFAGETAGGIRLPGTYVEACFGPRCQGAGDAGLAVAVTRAPGLDLDAYVRTHWIGDEPAETTVDGHPALATSIEADEAAGLVWSPQPEVVIELNIDSSMRGELRNVVDGIRLTG